jgi:hypothetical protein
MIPRSEVKTICGELGTLGVGVVGTGAAGGTVDRKERLQSHNVSRSSAAVAAEPEIRTFMTVPPETSTQEEHQGSALRTAKPTGARSFFLNEAAKRGPPERSSSKTARRECDPSYGTVVLRDQKPLNIARLSTALTVGSTKIFLAFINGRTFFWPTE